MSSSFRTWTLRIPKGETVALHSRGVDRWQSLTDSLGETLLFDSLMRGKLSWSAVRVVGLAMLVSRCAQVRPNGVSGKF